MNDKQLTRILEIKESIIKFEYIIKQSQEKIKQLQEEREKIELADKTEEIPPLEPESRGAED